MENRQQTQNTSREQDEGCVTWTVAEILERYNAGTFGIPHFQRGLVWDDAMLGDLLESLYFDTPCGAIVLWELENGLDDYGLPIGPRAADGEVQYLIVDGQQRVRSLGRVSGLLEAFRNHQCDESADEPQVWCINLARTREFQKLLQQGREFPLFSLRADRGYPRIKRSHLPYDFIPMRELATFENLESWTRHETYLSEKLRSREQVGTELLELRKVLGKILERKLFVRILKRVDFLEVVRVYTRINSAGKRVEAEERALATLSALDSETNQRLREMFVAVHGPDADSHDAIQERDARLGRHPERTLGFKFLMRAFVQACAQHSKLSADAASLSFDTVNRDSFRKVFAGDDAERKAEVWESAKRAVACVARVLRDELSCDDFRFVPDAASLIPVTQLLIRFPELAGDRYDPVVAALIFRAFLEEPQDPYKVAEDVRRSNKPLKEIIETLYKKLCDRRPDESVDMWLKEQLEQANSIQNRYVLLLYWLIRRKGARDFSYRNLPDGMRKGLLLGEEREVKASKVGEEVPEKQHIIPLSRIARNLEDAHSRARQGPAHNIGNLTYISSALNSFKTGLGAQLIDPSHDSDDDDKNLRAHMLRAEAKDDPDPLEAYKRVKELLESKNSDLKTAELLFHNFCAKRRTVIARAFLEWLKELDDRAKSVSLDNVRPDVPQLIEHKYLDLCETIRKRVRECGVPDKGTLEDVLIRMVKDIKQSNWRRRPLRVPTANSDRFAVFVRREEAGKRSEKSILVLEVDGTGMAIQLVDEGLGSVFDDLLKRLGQEAGSRQTRIGIDEARRVSADKDLTHIPRIVILARSRYGLTHC